MVQQVKKAWNAFGQAAGMGSIQNELRPYMLHNISEVMVEAIHTRGKDYALQLQ